MKFKIKESWYTILIVMFESVGWLRMALDTLLASEIKFPYDQYDPLIADFLRLSTVILIDGIMASAVFYVIFVPEKNPRVRTRKYLWGSVSVLMWAVQMWIGWEVAGLLGMATRIIVLVLLLTHVGEFTFYQVFLKVKSWQDKRTQDTRNTEQILRDTRTRAYKFAGKVSLPLVSVFVFVFVLLGQLLCVLGDAWKAVFKNTENVSGEIHLTHRTHRTRVGIHTEQRNTPHTPNTEYTHDTPQTRNTPHTPQALAIQDTHTAHNTPHTQHRGRNPYNVSFQYTDGEYKGLWQSACSVCGVSGKIHLIQNKDGELSIHKDFVGSSKGFAAHCSSNLHKYSKKGELVDAEYSEATV